MGRDETFEVQIRTPREIGSQAPTTTRQKQTSPHAGARPRGRGRRGEIFLTRRGERPDARERRLECSRRRSKCAAGRSLPRVFFPDPRETLGISARRRLTTASVFNRGTSGVVHRDIVANNPGYADGAPGSLAEVSAFRPAALVRTRALALDVARGREQAGSRPRGERREPAEREPAPPRGCVRDHSPRASDRTIAGADSVTPAAARASSSTLPSVAESAHVRSPGDMPRMRASASSVCVPRLLPTSSCHSSTTTVCTCANFSAASS